jgi:hypothetical protein
MNAIIRYFDLLANVRPTRPTAMSEAPGLQWIPQYCALLAGVLIQPYFAQYQSTHHWDLNGLPGWIVASLVISVIVFPAVYRGAFDPTKPWLIQIAPIFAGGLGWNSLFAIALSAASGGTHGAPPAPTPIPS